MPKTYSTKNPNTSFPAPKFRKVFDHPGKRNAVLFFRYWASIPEDKQELIEVKIYRTWPQVDVKITEPNRKDVVWDILDGKIPFEPDHYKEWFLERYYSGEWNVILAERGVQGKVMEAFFDATDMERFPPRVDLKTVLWDKAANRDYKRWCEQKQIQIPGKEGIEFQEAQEVNAGITATVDLAKTAMERSDRLQEANTSILREMAQEKVESPSALAKTVDMMADAGKSAVKMVTESAPKAYDPLPMVKEVFIMAKANDNSAALMQMFVTSMERQNDAMMKMHSDTLAYMKAKDEKAATAVIAAPRGILDMIAEEGPKLEALKNFMGWGSRRGHEDVPLPLPEPRSMWLEKLVEKPENLQFIMGGLALLSNMVATIWGKGGKPPEEVLANAGVVPPVNGNQPVKVEPAPEPQRQPTQAELNQMFLEFIEPVFLEHFFDPQKRGLNGGTFARAMLSIVQTPDGTQWAAGPVTPVGQQQYGLIKSDPKGFDRLLRSYSPIWGQVSAYAVQRADSKENPKYFQFLMDFFNYTPQEA